MKKLILFAVSVFCAILLLVGCGGSSDLVGVWDEVDGDGILYFAEENSGLSVNVVYTSESFEYEEKGDKLIFIAENKVETKYVVDENILTITADGVDYRYKLVALAESDIEGYLTEHGVVIHSDSGHGQTETYSETVVTTGVIPETDGYPEGGLSDDEIAESIVGAWKGGDDNIKLTYIFNEDGTGVAGLFPFTYSVKNGVISMEIKFNGEINRGSGRYEIDGDCMYVEDSDGTYMLQRTEIPEEFFDLINKKGQASKD